MSDAKTSWRDFIRVHPAAELFPLMTAEELDALAADIKAHEMRIPIITWFDKDGVEWLIDGRNRLDALERLGHKFSKQRGDYGECLKIDDWSTARTASAHHFNHDPYILAATFNLQRRHLTTEDRKRIAAEILQRQPEKSDRAIAKETKLSHPTIAAVRKEVEAEASTGKNFQLIPDADVQPEPKPTKRIGADGKARKMPAAKAAAPDPRIVEPLEPAARATVESAEPMPATISPEDHFDRFIEHLRKADAICFAATAQKIIQIMQDDVADGPNGERGMAAILWAVYDKLPAGAQRAFREYAGLIEVEASPVQSQTDTPAPAVADAGEPQTVDSEAA